MEYKGYKGIIPQPETVKKWLLTRKRSETEVLRFGDFAFPGIYTVQHYTRDKGFFILALLGEVAFLAIVSVLLGGFDMLMSLIAVALVVLDFIGAYLYHKNEDEICKAELSLSIANYREKSVKTATDDVKISSDCLKMLKGNFTRRLGAGLIILSAILKIAGSAVLFEIIALTVVLTVIYCFVAYVHINKTGFWFAGWRFYSAMDNETSNYIMNNKNETIKSLDKENDFTLLKVENIPADVNLKPIKRHVFENTNIFDSLVLVGRQGEEGADSPNNGAKEWHYRIWKHQFWDDDDLQAFINSKAGNEVLDDKAKAFIAADISKRKFLNVQ